jgi:methylphosphotriester-DNA--protein-cysteine methyltransferase
MRKVAAFLFLLPFVVSAVQASPTDVVYTTKTGHKYHTATCSSLRKSKIKTTVKEAKKQGMEPCRRCHPPVA